MHFTVWMLYLNKNIKRSNINKFFFNSFVSFFLLELTFQFHFLTEYYSNEIYFYILKSFIEHPLILLCNKTIGIFSGQFQGRIYNEAKNLEILVWRWWTLTFFGTLHLNCKCFFIYACLISLHGKVNSLKAGIILGLPQYRTWYTVVGSLIHFSHSFM